MRPDEHLTLTTLAELETQQADMLTVVLVGNSQSYRMGGYLVTPRGYEARRSGLWPAPEERAAVQPADQHQTQPAATYPINLAHMQGAAVLVVGGGTVGERKIGGLLAVQARVTLISPQATPRLREWAQQGRIAWQQQPYQAGSIADSQSTRPLLVFAATSERSVNAQVAQEAAALGILCNVADAPAEGSIHLPAVHRGAGLVIAVSSEGTSPARSRQVRDRIAELLNTEMNTSL
jgi:cobalt-precorrin 5A hydrolase/precorrin-3B C17-methyltransferase